MQNLLVFVHALLAYWIAYLGVALTVAPFLELIPYVERKWPFATKWKKTLRILAVVCLVIALYQAWLGEHLNSQILIEQKAQLTGENQALHTALNRKQDEIGELTRQLATRATVSGGGRDFTVVTDQLGALLLEGDRIADKTCGVPTIPVLPECAKAKKDWEAKVAKYLRANLGLSYSDRWKHAIREFMPDRPGQQVGYEANELNKIISELK